MLDIIKAWTDYLFGIFAALPDWFLAMLGGWAVSAFGTQWLKFMLPLRWEHPLRARMAALIAFLLGFVTTYMLLPSRGGVVLGIVVGVASPTAYAGTVRLIGYFFPKVRAALSADVRKGDTAPKRGTGE